MISLLSILIAFGVDMVLGDPRWLPHPICLMGNVISFLEKRLRAICGEKPEWQLMGGFVLVVFMLTTAFGIPYYILQLAQAYDMRLAFAINTFMLYQIFALRSLRNAGLDVLEPLHKGDIDEARLKLSWIVGRDTQNLNEEEITKATVETIAENTGDGVIAPMFYMFIGGAPLALLYKAINTMDSMIGYKNDKYLYFGRCAAKLDDVANFIPARIAAFCMLAAAYFLNMNTAGAWKIFKRDRYNHLSPNSAMTESVAAGAMDLQLGGGHYYFGKFVPKPTIGDEVRSAEPEDVLKANSLLFFSSILCIIAFSLVYLLFNFTAFRSALNV